MAADEGQPVGEANAVLTFRDEQGREWLAGAFIGDLVRFEDGEAVDRMTPEATKDRAFMLHELKLVSRA